MPVLYKDCGTAQSSTEVVYPEWPTHISGDVGLLFVESCGGDAVGLIPGEEQGFIPIGGSPQHTGDGTNGTRLTAYWARASSSSMSPPSVRLSSPTGAGSHIHAVIATFQGCLTTGNPCGGASGGVKAVASITTTFSSVFTTVDFCTVVAVATRDDSSSTAAWSGWTAAMLSSLTERYDGGTTVGNGGGLCIATGQMGVRGQSGAITATVRNSTDAHMCISLIPTPTPFFQAVGTTSRGHGFITPAWPTHLAGDVGLLFIETCGGDDAAPVFVNSSGFEEVDGSPQATGAGTTGTRLSVYWCRASSTTAPAPKILDPGNHIMAVIMTFRGCVEAGEPWNTTAGGVGSTPWQYTNWSAVNTTVDNCLIVLAASREYSGATGQYSDWAMEPAHGATNLQERYDGGGTVGNGGGLVVATADMNAYGDTGWFNAQTPNTCINGHITIALAPSRAPFIQSIGTVFHGLGHVDVAWPTHLAGDIGVLLIHTCGGEAPWINGTEGWTEFPSSPQFVGTGGAGARLTMYWRRALSGLTYHELQPETHIDVPVAVVDPGDHIEALIIIVRGCIETGDPINVSDGAVKAVASTTTTFPSVHTTVDNCPLFLAAAHAHSTTEAAFSNWVGAGVGNLAEILDLAVADTMQWFGSPYGIGGGLGVAVADLASNGDSGEVTASLYNSATDVSTTTAFTPSASPYLSGDGVLVSAASGSISPAWPAHAENDIGLLVVESRGDATVSLSVAAGFAEVANSPSYTGNWPSRSTRITVFWCRATAPTMTAPTLSASAGHVAGKILAFRGCITTGNPWNATDVSYGLAPDNATVSFAEVSTSVANTLIVMLSATCGQYQNSFTLDTESLSAEYLRYDSTWFISNDGYHHGLELATGSLAAAGDSGSMSVADGYGYFPLAFAAMTIALRGPASPALNALLTVVGTPVGEEGEFWIEWPQHAADDVALLIVESRAEEEVTLHAGEEAGFVSLPISVSVGDSPPRYDVTVPGTRLSLFWCRATSGAMNAPRINSPGNHFHAMISVFRGCIKTGNPWDVTAGSSGTNPNPAALISFDTPNSTVNNTLGVFIATVAGYDGTAGFTGTGVDSAFNRYLGSYSSVYDWPGSPMGIYFGTGAIATAGSYGPVHGPCLFSTSQPSFHAKATVLLKGPTPPPSGPKDWVEWTITNGALVTDEGNFYVSWPTHMANDIGLLIVKTLGAEAVGLNEPWGGGFVEIESSPVSSGSSISDIRTTIFWCRATSAAMPPARIYSPGSGYQAVIATFRSCTQSGYPINVEATGYTTNVGTTVTFPSVTTTENGTLIVMASSAADCFGFSGWTADSLIDLSERYDDYGTAYSDVLALASGVFLGQGATGTLAATLDAGACSYFTLALLGRGEGEGGTLIECMHIRGQRINSAGTILWDEGGVRVTSPLWEP